MILELFGENTFIGDSGAGLVVEVDGVHQVVGVVSGGTGVCGERCRGIMNGFIVLSWIHRYIFKQTN